MKCEKCGEREATCFYRENINGKETKAYLCSQCAAEKESGFSLGDIFSGGLMGHMFAPAKKKNLHNSDEEKCSLCGCSYSYITKNGKVGCPKCYESFASYLDGAIRRMHGNTTHRGRVPRGYREKLSAKREAEQLETELKEAIAREEYEKAATLRDKIRQLRGQA